MGGVACAGQAPPPGGPEDRRPPVVVRTEPDTFARTAGFGGPVRFHFNERISERVGGGGLDAAVVVSPRTGAVRVQHGRRGLSVSIEGGYRPGLVYRVTLLPMVRDMFNNQLVDPFELVFSTGAEPTPNAVAGVVWDRLTGRGVAGVEVRAGDEAAPHVAVTDREGIYALRYVPPGSYRVRAFEDLNRNGEIDFIETQGEAPLDVGPADTVFLDVPVLLPDTSAAVLAGLTVVDSVTLIVELDDYVDPLVSLEAAAILVERDDGPAPSIDSVYHEHEYVAFVAEVTDSLARLDSLEASMRAQLRVLGDTVGGGPGDSARADTATAPVDSAVVVSDTAARDAVTPADTVRAAPRRRPPTSLPGARAPAGRGGGPGDRGPLPTQRLVVRLASPLEPDVPYRVIVTGVPNIAAVPNGGGIDSVRIVPPPLDTTTVGGDTVGVDTVGVDTLGARVDTTGVGRGPR